LIDLVRKKFWLSKKETESAKTKEMDPPTLYEACPQTFQPVGFFAYKKLHNHVKLQIVASNKRTNSDPEAGNEGTVRSKTPSRKKQRQMDKTLKEGTVPASLSTASPLSTSGSATGMRDLMETKLQATRFNQKFALAKFCVEQDIEGGKEMIQAMMANEMRKESSGTKKKLPPASTVITNMTLLNESTLRS
jgi:hypothetical protein